MRYLLSGLFLAGTFLVPSATLLADDHHRDDHRYYDRKARDWHEWNEQENKAYRKYWEDTHRGRAFRDWNRVNSREQAAYWRWRHEHSDSALWR